MYYIVNITNNTLPANFLTFLLVMITDRDSVYIRKISLIVYNANSK